MARCLAYVYLLRRRGSKLPVFLVAPFCLPIGCSSYTWHVRFPFLVPFILFLLGRFSHQASNAILRTNKPPNMVARGTTESTTMTRLSHVTERLFGLLPSLYWALRGSPRVPKKQMNVMTTSNVPSSGVYQESYSKLALRVSSRANTIPMTKARANKFICTHAYMHACIHACTHLFRMDP